MAFEGKHFKKITQIFSDLKQSEKISIEADFKMQLSDKLTQAMHRKHRAHAWWRNALTVGAMAATMVLVVVWLQPKSEPIFQQERLALNIDEEVRPFPSDVSLSGVELKKGEEMVDMQVRAVPQNEPKQPLSNTSALAPTALMQDESLLELDTTSATDADTNNNSQ